MYSDSSPAEPRPLLLTQIVFWFAMCIVLFIFGWRSGNRGHLGLHLLIAAGASECVERPMLRYAGIDAGAPAFQPACRAALPRWGRLVRVGACCPLLAGLGLMFFGG